MSSVWIVDIDDTIADHEHRLHLLKHACSACGRVISYNNTRKVCPCGCDVYTIPDASWTAFTNPAIMVNDKPFTDAQAVILKAKQFGTEIHFITGRTDDARAVTQEWLTNHFGFDKTKQKLLMRVTGGPRSPASAYKEQAFKRLLEMCSMSGTEHFHFFDDDPFVLQMYAKYGIVHTAPTCWSSMVTPKVLGSEPIFCR